MTGWEFARPLVHDSRSCFLLEFSATCLFFLALAPWPALAAVGRGASGEKDMS